MILRWGRFSYSVPGGVSGTPHVHTASSTHLLLPCMALIISKTEEPPVVRPFFFAWSLLRRIDSAKYVCDQTSGEDSLKMVIRSFIFLSFFLWVHSGKSGTWLRTTSGKKRDEGDLPRLPTGATLLALWRTEQVCEGTVLRTSWLSTGRERERGYGIEIPKGILAISPLLGLWGGETV